MMMNYSNGGGIVVAKGRYNVPTGVAVKELKNYYRSNKLLNDCPQKVKDLLNNKRLTSTYNSFIETISTDQKTYSKILGKMNDDEINSKIEKFRNPFERNGIKVALCKRKSGRGIFRWLEFIDIDKLGNNYVPQYDTANLSDQIINTWYNELEFPNGVAVKELENCSFNNKNKRSKDGIPPYLEKLLEKTDLLMEYNELVEDLVNANKKLKFCNWDTDACRDVIKEHSLQFEKKGVSIFLSCKRETIRTEVSIITDVFRWIEFVDREEQPNYLPQRNAENASNANMLFVNI